MSRPVSGGPAAGLLAPPEPPVPAPVRIAHITARLFPSDDTATIQVVQTVAALARSGAAIDLVLPRRPGRPPAEGSLRAGLRERYGVEGEFGLRQLPSRFSSVEWIANGSHALLASLFASPHRYDVVHTRDFETAWLCLRLGRRVLFETYRPLTRRSRFHRAVLRRSVAHPGFLGLVTHSGFVAEQYRSDGVRAEQIRTVYNGFDPKPFAIERTPSDARRMLGVPERVTVTYAGRIAAIKRIDLLLDAASRTPELQWILAGRADTPEAATFVERGRALPNVQFAGFLRGERLALALQAADILVIPPSADPLLRFGRTVLPMKVFQYLAAGRPIVTGNLPDTAELLVHERNSVRVPPDSVDDLVDAVRALAADPARRERLGRSARRDAAGLTWDARAAALLAFLTERLAAVGRRSEA